MGRLTRAAEAKELGARHVEALDALRATHDEERAALKKQHEREDQRERDAKSERKRYSEE
jgi:hypothetical protein